MSSAISDLPTCGVCGRPVTDDSFEPPTFSMVEVEPGVKKPVLSKPIRIDPETGAVCWCTTEDSG